LDQRIQYACASSINGGFAMKQFNALFGTLAAVAVTVACFESNAAITGNAALEANAQGAAIMILADNSSTPHDEDAKPAVGGEGDDAIGGDAPNPEPDRSASTVADDASITAKVKSKLLADTMVSGLKIDVDTRSGVVYLTGDNMKSQAAIDQAMKLAKSTDGVTKVVSKLAVGDVKN
jgi:hyperosmotically inducible protein